MGISEDTHPMKPPVPSRSAFSGVWGIFPIRIHHREQEKDGQHNESTYLPIQHRCRLKWHRPIRPSPLPWTGRGYWRYSDQFCRQHNWRGNQTHPTGSYPEAEKSNQRTSGNTNRQRNLIHNSSCLNQLPTTTRHPSRVTRQLSSHDLHRNITISM